ncbi:MAG TPA: hypothetical protein VLA34_03610, partial [Candidatus Krumholzibacterium sp.]|nr:hypothetical protein [Candidatus Krumholzibacterium sp.]
MAKRYSEWRIRLVSIFSAIIVCVLVYRIIQVQVIRHEAYKEIAKRQWHRKIKWSARRGCIYDRNGYPVAVSHRTYTIGITPRDFPKRDEAVDYLASVVGSKPAAIKRLLRKDDPYVFVARDVSLSGEEEARLSSFSGVKLDADPERMNPLSSMVPGFVGSIDREGKGNAGIELAFQDDLMGSDGWMLVNMDANDQAFRPVNAPGKKPTDGRDIFLTTDAGIQSIVDFELQQAIERYGARGGAALVVDPWTGDVIALSEKSCPGRDNDSEWNSAGKLYSTSCIYEPGSTFKL